MTSADTHYAIETIRRIEAAKITAGLTRMVLERVHTCAGAKPLESGNACR
ncbi:hypothetical protein [Aromatoleum diolicum]|uniref:Uncharacterized protein n=1 Tax=Aromatoleum diolicum TaxID=75796 RepID=A0ABX1QIE1_9RHOO|nr:hypothetical protein [Aromatoleum diolicum]NMG77352.1 hypothetical protein [Aromatoleum diolicum]